MPKVTGTGSNTSGTTESVNYPSRQMFSNSSHKIIVGSNSKDKNSYSNLKIEKGKFLVIQVKAEKGKNTIATVVEPSIRGKFIFLACFRAGCGQREVDIELILLPVRLVKLVT